MQPKRVAILVDASGTWGTQVIAGISDFVRQNDRWLLHLDSPAALQTKPPANWQGDGIIVQDKTYGVSLRRTNQDDVQRITVNEIRVGEIAAQTLLATGLQDFAFLGPPSHDMLRSFAKALQEAGVVVPVRQFDEPVAFQNLADWLKSLKTPCGILTTNCLQAHAVIEACYWAGLRVPNDIAVLAGEHDYLLAEISTPKLTCIDQAPRQLGFRAAAELNRLMSGGSVMPPLLIEPQGVAYRESVPHAVINDDLVAESVAFIQANSHRNITITDLIEHIPASRRSLELRFRRALGRGPATEIRRLRLNNACKLLSETDLPVKQIASKCGFASTEQLQRQLRSQTSMTPTHYREIHQYPMQADRSTPIEIAIVGHSDCDKDGIGFGSKMARRSQNAQIVGGSAQSELAASSAPKA